MPSPETTRRKSVPGIQIASFDLCQNIGMEIEEAGRRITAHAVHFPATHAQIKANLQALKQFADRALTVIDMAQAEWRKEHA